MIPLIQCSDSDAERYYHQTLVWFNGTPYIFNRKEGRAALVIDQHGNSVSIPFSELRHVTLPPFYAQDGQYIGTKVNRSTKRGETYSRKLFGDILSLLNTGDVPRTETRINKDWFVKKVRGVPVVMYRGSVVGFRSLSTGVYCVQDTALAERLTQLLGDTNAVVRSFT